jgi:hypothetical protein
MVENKGIQFKENAEFANNDQLSITDKQYAGANFEAAEPLKIGQPYLLVPQLNTAVKYEIDGIPNPVFSKCAWLMPIDGAGFGGQVRTLGFSAMRASGYKEIMDAKDVKAPDVSAVQVNGKWKFGSKAVVRAMEDTSFIKGREDSQKRKRFAITRPVIITPMSESRVFVSSFDNGELAVKNNKLVLELKDNFMKFKVEECNNAELVQAVTAALKSTDGIKDHFYALD